MAISSVTYIHMDYERVKTLIHDEAEAMSSTPGFAELVIHINHVQLSLFHARAGSLNIDETYEKRSITDTHILLKAMGLTGYECLFDQWFTDGVFVKYSCDDAGVPLTVILAGGRYDLLLASPESAKTLHRMNDAKINSSTIER